MKRLFCIGKKAFCDNPDVCGSCDFADGSGSVNEWTLSALLTALFGKDYDLDRLRELVQADRRGRVHIGRCLECNHYEGLAECEYLGNCGGTDWICGWFEPKESALKAMKEREDDDRA